ncbi:MAG TPA: MbcA/ParS/Xre antitoxin family protein [Bryobacteraceae bacterium]
MKAHDGDKDNTTLWGDRQRAILAHAIETFGSDAKANHWLNQPLDIFQGRTPLRVLETEPDEVEMILTRIEHNILT